MGCREALSGNKAAIRCRFAKSGFPFADGAMALPCNSAYHCACFRVGFPFLTRLRDGKGLTLPPLPDFQGFICEACTVRAAMNRELSPRVEDGALLMLERMRLIDMVFYWSLGTHQQYQGKVRVLRRFGERFEVSFLQCTPILRPPVADSIPIQWAQEWYALQPARWRRSTDTSTSPGNSRVGYGTVRALRSAASQFFRLDMIFSTPDSVYMDQSHRVIRVSAVCPTDSLEATLFQKGFAVRTGRDAKPSTALHVRHVLYLDRSLRKMYGRASSRLHKLEVARAGLANALFWMGWLRSQEGFSLRWGDILITLPGDGASEGLEPGIGVVKLKLLEDTKTSRNATADIILAFCSALGLSPGFWLMEIKNLLGSTPDPNAHVFVHPDGSKWDSAYFRGTYLIPSLTEQRLNGDVLLKPYTGTPGNTMAEKFWSMHSYRRGGRSQVNRVNNGALRQASETEVFEHGRWRLAPGSLNMAQAYNA